MTDQTSDGLIYFNGLNLETGGYFDEPMTVEELAAVANKYRFTRDSLEALQAKKSGAEASFGVPIEFGLGDDLKKVGWGMIFPAQADPLQVEAILEAMKDLTELRQEQAGSFFKIIKGKDGYRWFNGQAETKTEFLKRSELAPGEFSPGKLPFYLLIVADPQSIPFAFQHELDVQYAVGRIYFQTLQEYANYAHSVVEAEKGHVRLKRRAVFFGVNNQGDKATGLSAEYLIKPLHNHVLTRSAQSDLGWESTLVEPADALKENLQAILGGAQAPAIFFSASHGAGWPYAHELQYRTQGGLVCQDWRRFDAQEKPALAHILTAAEIPDTANLLGSIIFPFACFSLGTPYKDEFAMAMLQERSRLAPRPFLSALPVRMLGHPNGGALAVIGHVDRAWPHSFGWGELKSTTGAFESLLTNLMNGLPVGLAMDRMNLRYAEIATTLADNLRELAFSEDYISLSELTYEWTANNDARGYAILGDPAAKLSLAPAGTTIDTRPSIQISSRTAGALPVIFAAPALQELDEKEQQVVTIQNEAIQKDAGPFSVEVSIDLEAITPGVPEAVSASPPGVASLETGQPPADQGAEPGRRGGQSETDSDRTSVSPFDRLAGAVRKYSPDESSGPVDDSKPAVGPILEDLYTALRNVADQLKQATASNATLQVSTSVVEDLDGFDADHPDPKKARARYRTTISLAGDIDLYLPREQLENNEVLLELHRGMVQQAQSNRLEMIKTLGELVASLFGATP